MTPEQEEALYEFLESVTEPFTLENVTAYIRMMVSHRSARMVSDIADFINSRNLAFRMGPDQWLSKRGCFEPIRFVISPTRLELLNGILIPGHRCVPFANPALLPHEYTFCWQGEPIPWGTTEGPPDDFYPYYSIFGEEYAPQYIARDNPDNENAYNCDPYEDPPEVSIHTLDMRNIYRETSFVPGDHFLVETLNWKEGTFEITRIGKDEWSQADLDSWCEAAEAGFAASFEYLGPGSSTDEQLAFAYWFGKKRMGETPAYALEEFLYEKTDSIETVAYGIESRFWYAGKEIPDRENLEGYLSVSDRTMIEDILNHCGIPISEYVLQSYVRDALFRKEPDVSRIIDRVVPKSAGIAMQDQNALMEYLFKVYNEFRVDYSFFSDQNMGPIRQRVGELHTAVIDIVARLHKGDIDPSWLPKHTFVMLSQIQNHAAALMEDLDGDEALPEGELEAMDNSLDSMIETYEEIKELIDDALRNFRRNNFSVVKASLQNGPVLWRTLQLSLGGTEVWRRIVLPGSSRLEELHQIIRTLFGWDDRYSHRFTALGFIREEDSLEEVATRGLSEISYEYGTVWTVKVIFLSSHEPAADERIRCVAGERAVPPATVEGPLRFKKFLSALERGGADSVTSGVSWLVQPKTDFDPEAFDMEAFNRQLEGIIYGRTKT